MKETRGFTLIELLVVIAIIGLLATMAVVSFGGAQKKARDARRKADIRQISKALELYYDMYGAYPIGTAGSDRSCWEDNEGYSSCHPLGALKDAELMGRVPVDPGKNTYIGTHGDCEAAEFYGYGSPAGGQTYVLATNLETESSACLCSFGFSGYEYCVTNQQ